MQLSPSQVSQVFQVLVEADEGCHGRACDQLAEAFGGELGFGEAVSVPSSLSSEQVLDAVGDPQDWWEAGCVEACEQLVALVS